MRFRRNSICMGMMMVLMICQTAVSQRHIHTSYTKSSGLPSDYVFHIGQSPEGQMWFGTERGAARYDGNQFRIFTTSDGLPNNFVYGILTDSKGRTWFGTAADTPSYLQYGRIRTMPIDWRGTGGIYDIVEVADDTLVFRFMDGLGVLAGNRYRFHSIPMRTTKESRLNLDTDGSIVIADGHSVLRLGIRDNLDLRIDTLIRFEQHYPFMSTALAPDGTLYTHHRDEIWRHGIEADGAVLMERHRVPLGVWLKVRPTNGGHEVIIGSRVTGLQRLADGRVTPLMTDKSNDSGQVTALHIDYEGNLWAGFFGDGVEKFSNWNTLRLNVQTGLTIDNVWRMRLAGDVLYLLSKQGIDVIDATTLSRIGRIPIETGIRGLEVIGDTMLVATISDLRAYRMLSPSRITGHRLFGSDMGDGVNDIVTGADGSVWVATAGRFLRRRKPDGAVERFVVENGVERVVRIGDDIWWLTSDDGAHRYRNGDIRTFTLESGDLPSNNVTSVARVGTDVLIGTSKGLVRIDGTDKSGRITQQDGLMGTNVLAILSRDVHSAWIVTSEQLHLIDAAGLRPAGSLGTLQSELASAHWHTYHPDMSRWFISTPNGVLAVDLGRPARILPAPKVSISSFRLNEIQYRIWQADSIRDRSASSTLDIMFHGLTFVQENLTRYTYKLEGLEDNWSPPQRANTVRYANLPPGTYVFRVKALNVDNRPTTGEATLRITIPTPYWMHPVTRVLLVMLLVAVVVVIGRHRVATFKREVVRRNEQRQFEAIQRVGASISHDIRNTVFSLNLLARNLEKRFDNPEFRKDAIETIESSLQYLTKLVEQLQQKPEGYAVRSTVFDAEAVVTDVIRRQRDITPGIRFENLLEPGERLGCDRDLLLRILENLVRNAAEAMNGMGEIRISRLDSGDEFMVCVSDNGPGMTPDFIRDRLFRPFQSTKTKGLGIGLYTCQELAKAMGGKIDVTSKPGIGSTFCIRLPKTS